MIRFCFLDPRPMLFIGSFTMTLAGIVACVESDIKKVVALRTLSQLGVMMVSIGAQEKRYCFFHLLSHACFKALLFICIGTRIHSIFGNQDYRNIRGLRSNLMVALFTQIALISLIGFMFTSGYYRKDIILEAIIKRGLHSSMVLLFLISIGLTSFYSFKIIYCTMFMRLMNRSPETN